MAQTSQHRPDFRVEDGLGLAGNAMIAGVDEVGRGSLAGPVTAAAIVLDRRRLPTELVAIIDDSKRLNSSQRSDIAKQLAAFGSIGIGWAERPEIDALNILGATMLAMQRSVGELVRRLGRHPDHVLIDGNRCPSLPCPATAVIRGDRQSLSIAAASILAKTARDARMTEFAARFPGYGWECNAGYGTAQHLRGLREFGPTPEHRRSFAPVAAAADERNRPTD